MSIQAVAWVLDQSESRGYARLVLISLANHVNVETGECWPAMRTIAAEAGISVSTVHEHVAKLVELGEVEIVEQGGPRKSSRYRLTFVGRPSAEHKRSPTERSVRPRTNAAFAPEPNRTVIEPSFILNPPSPPVNGGELPELRLAKEWCRLTGQAPTRSVLKKYVPEVREFIAAKGVPTVEFLELCLARGINTPGGWGFVSEEPRASPEWKPPDKGGTYGMQIPNDPKTCKHIPIDGDGWCTACKTHQMPPRLRKQLEEQDRKKNNQ